jgi:hypothetical protein
VIIVMALQRQITCPFCPDGDQAKAIPPHWTTDYAMAWFHTTHLLEHVEQMIACDPCVKALWATGPHRPCFDPDCDCECSYTTTTERTADADG